MKNLLIILISLISLNINSQTQYSTDTLKTKYIKAKANHKIYISDPLVFSDNLQQNSAVTSTLFSNWNSAYNLSHSHANYLLLTSLDSLLTGKWLAKYGVQKAIHDSLLTHTVGGNSDTSKYLKNKTNHDTIVNIRYNNSLSFDEKAQLYYDFDSESGYYSPVFRFKSHDSYISKLTPYSWTFQHGSSYIVMSSMGVDITGQYMVNGIPISTGGHISDTSKYIINPNFRVRSNGLAQGVKFTKDSTQNDSTLQTIGGVKKQIIGSYNTPSKGLTFSGVVDLTNHISSNYNDLTISSNLAITVSSSPVDGTTSGVVILGDGTHTPTFSGMYGDATKWTIGTGARNLIAFWQLWGHTYFSITLMTIN